MRLEVQKSYLISCDLRFKIIFYIYKCFFARVVVSVTLDDTRKFMKSSLYVALKFRSLDLTFRSSGLNRGRQHFSHYGSVQAWHYFEDRHKKRDYSSVTKVFQN